MNLSCGPSEELHSWTNMVDCDQEVFNNEPVGVFLCTCHVVTPKSYIAGQKLLLRSVHFLQVVPVEDTYALSL